MSITLSNGFTSIDLNPDLLWADEYKWQELEQSVERTITGAMVLSSAAKIGGRPITLQPETPDSGWTTRAGIEQLRNWAAGPSSTFQLTLRGITRNVVFRHTDGAAVDATPVVHFSDIGDADYYLATLRFMEI